jgi:hypothetical protein
VEERILAQSPRQQDPTLFVIIYEDGAAILGLFVAFCGVFLTNFSNFRHRWLLHFDRADSNCCCYFNHRKQESMVEKVLKEMGAFAKSS